MTPNKTDAGNGSYGICRACNVHPSPSPDPKSSANYNMSDSNRMKHYNAPWSRTLTLASVLFTIVLLSITLAGWRGIVSLQLSTTEFWLSILPLSIVVGAALFMVRGYSITNDGILIHRLFWDTKLSRQGLQSAAMEPGALRGTLRTFGNSGLFGFTGWYQSSRLGSFRAFATDGSRTVVLRYAEKTIVITPDQPDLFVQELSANRETAE